jgi:glycosyltransferase involved in cell wall biosynthesis
MIREPMPLVSVLTPAYNEEKYISECIESVLAQTYPNWEYVIVDNCSTDKTVEIARSYAAKDPRISIIDAKPFVPAMANINRTFRQVSKRSKYCKMVLADDWIFPECLERMVALAEENPSVGIVGAYGLLDGRVEWVGLPYPSTVVLGREACRQRLLGGPYVFGSSTSVLFRSDLVRNRDPFYDESNVHADSTACLDLLKQCDFGFVHQVLSFSRERPASLVKASLELNTVAHNILHELIAYGPFYLTPEEFQDRLKITVSNYYRFLTTSLLQRREKKFWDYHKAMMKQEGMEFSYARLVYSLWERLLGKFSHLREIRKRRYWGI